MKYTDTRSNLIGAVVLPEDSTIYSCGFTPAKDQCCALDNVTTTDMLVAYLFDKEENGDLVNWSLVNVPGQTMKLAPSYLEYEAEAVEATYLTDTLSFSATDTKLYLVKIIASAGNEAVLTNGEYTFCDGMLNDDGDYEIKSGVNTFLVTATATDTITIELDDEDTTARTSVYELTGIDIDTINRLY